MKKLIATPALGLAVLGFSGAVLAQAASAPEAAASVAAAVAPAASAVAEAASAAPARPARTRSEAHNRKTTNMLKKIFASLVLGAALFGLTDAALAQAASAAADLTARQLMQQNHLRPVAVQ